MTTLSSPHAPLDRDARTGDAQAHTDVWEDVLTSAGTRIPAAEVRARRVAREAERWLAFAASRTRMRTRTLTRKALSACAFSVHHRTRSLAVPSKLVGTSRHQGLLRGLADLQGGSAPWDVLDLDVQDDRVGVLRGGRPLGEVQTKHLPWVRPLVPFGLGLRLVRVTGTDRARGDHYGRALKLGCNVAITGVGEALAGMAGERTASGGDGASAVPKSGLRLVVPGEARPPQDSFDVRVLPEREALDGGPSLGDPDDVVLWRTREGAAHASVPHVVRHSPTGIEWGYLGSGPSDLALSVLTALADGRVAGALYQRFKQEVVARVPEQGGVLRAAEVRAWVERARTAERSRAARADQVA
jgi:hypothetical protein